MRADWTGPVSRRLGAWASRLVQRATVRTRLASAPALPAHERQVLERRARRDRNRAVWIVVGAQVASRWGL